MVVVLPEVLLWAGSISIVKVCNAMLFVVIFAVYMYMFVLLLNKTYIKYLPKIYIDVSFTFK